MEKINLRKLALLGLTGGLVVGGPTIETYENLQTNQFLIATHKSKGSIECSGFTPDQFLSVKSEFQV